MRLRPTQPVDSTGPRDDAPRENPRCVPPSESPRPWSNHVRNPSRPLDGGHRVQQRGMRLGQSAARVHDVGSPSGASVCSSTVDVGRGGRNRIQHEHAALPRSPEMPFVRRPKVNKPRPVAVDFRPDDFCCPATMYVRTELHRRGGYGAQIEDPGVDRLTNRSNVADNVVIPGLQIEQRCRRQPARPAARGCQHQSTSQASITNSAAACNAI